MFFIDYKNCRYKKTARLERFFLYPNARKEAKKHSKNQENPKNEEIHYANRYGNNTHSARSGAREKYKRSI